LEVIRPLIGCWSGGRQIVIALVQRRIAPDLIRGSSVASLSNGRMPLMATRRWKLVTSVIAAEDSIVVATGSLTVFLTSA
jgi:hypothetical protein